MARKSKRKASTLKLRILKNLEKTTKLVSRLAAVGIQPKENANFDQLSPGDRLAAGLVVLQREVTALPDTFVFLKKNARHEFKLKDKVSVREELVELYGIPETEVGTVDFVVLRKAGRGQKAVLHVAFSEGVAVGPAADFDLVA